MTLTRDPKGYYIALGIDEAADADAIKSAYRRKAKRLHPDFNPSPIAAKQFHRLHEAYETLSDPAKRAAYDRPWRGESPKPAASGATDAQTRRPEAQRGAETEKANGQAHGAARSKGESIRTSTSTRIAEQPITCKCGKITAQPRYIIFDLVWGRLNKLQRRGVTGIYCRSCADRTAIRSSLITWIAGWWAWPNGPKETVKALLNNIRGGRKPPDRNARLLIRQARAFKSRGEMELARSAAEQAITFAATPQLRHEVDSLLLSLSAHHARSLRDRWAKPGWSATVQLLPLAVIVGGLSMSAALLAPNSLTALVREFFDTPSQTIDYATPAFLQAAPARSSEAVPGILASPLPTGRVYSVAAKQAGLRTGPGDNYQLVSVLSQGAVVLVTEADPNGTWLRVATPDGASGFMVANQLSPDVRIDALEDARQQMAPGSPRPQGGAPGEVTRPLP